MDERYVGAHRRRGKRGRGAAGKLPVFGILERGGKVKVEVVPDRWLERLLGREMPRDVMISFHRVPRANYNFLDRMIYLGEDAAGRTLVHEFGHAIDDLFPEIHQASLRWIMDRAAGERPTPFNELWRQKVAEGRLPNDPHPAVKDKLPDGMEYVGKLYGLSEKYHATEVTSMGLEHFYDDPLRLWKSFPELFEHIATIIQMLR